MLWDSGRFKEIIYPRQTARGDNSITLNWISIIIQQKLVLPGSEAEHLDLKIFLASFLIPVEFWKWEAPVILFAFTETIMAPNPNEPEKCPFNTEHYPPVAPIPASRLSRKSSKTRMTSGASSGLAVPPNLPSRCTWKPNAKNSPHSVDPRCVLNKETKSRKKIFLVKSQLQFFLSNKNVSIWRKNHVKTKTIHKCQFDAKIEQKFETFQFDIKITWTIKRHSKCLENWVEIKKYCDLM